MTQPLQPAAIEARLRLLDPGFPWTLRCLEETTSTLDEAARAGIAGAAEGLAVFAESQSRGRGRRGARWHAEPGRHLLFSLLLRPAFPVSLWPRLTPTAALAVCQAVEGLCGLRPQVKWPNDLLLAGSKICGILTETQCASPQERFAVIGIGLNVGPMIGRAPAELRGFALSLEEAGGNPVDRAFLAAEILARFSPLYRQAADGFPAILEGVRERSALLGRTVTAADGGRRLRGLAVDLGQEGELLLRTADGITHVLRGAHEVRLDDGIP